MAIPYRGDAWVGFGRNALTEPLDFLVCSTADADAPVDNLRNWAPARLVISPGAGSPNATSIVLQTSSAFAVDAIGIYAHNLLNVATAVTITQGGTTLFEDSTGASWSRGNAVFMPCTPFDASTTTTVVRITHTSRLKIGLLWLGERTRLYYPQLVERSLPIWPNGREVSTNVSQSGALLGRTIRQGSIPFAIEQPAVPASWARSTWRELLEHAEARPFFYSWNQAAKPSDAVCAVADTPLAAPVELYKGVSACALQCQALPV